MPRSTRRMLKNWVNSGLKWTGSQINSIWADNFQRLKHRELVEEMHALYSHLVFPNLPECPGRIDQLCKLMGIGVSEALYIIKYLHDSMVLEGDICEFGIAQGATAALLANEMKAGGKCLWLFDSFQGLPKPSEKDVLKNDIFGLGSIKSYQGKMACSAEEVQERLSEISFPSHRLKIVKGFVEETLSMSNLPKNICFAFVDLDFYEPILTALSFVDKVLPRGGVIVVDDYDYFSVGAKAAVEEFLSSHHREYKQTFPFDFLGKFCVLQKQ